MKGDDMEALMQWQNGVLDNMTRGQGCGDVLWLCHFQGTPWQD